MTTTGILFIVAAPSGAGKTSLVRALLARHPGIQLSVSYTTRAPRPGERDGTDYHFVSRDAFLAMQAHGDFLESAEVYGNLYGTSRSWIEQQLAAGQDILLEIDWQGARQVRQLFPDAVGIYVLPPSLAALQERLIGRGQDSAEIIARRLAAAREDVAHVSEFDYVIINNDFDRASADLDAVVLASHLTSSKQLARHQDLLNQFRNQE